MVTVERPVFQSKSDILFEKIINEKKHGKKHVEITDSNMYLRGPKSLKTWY